MERAEQIYIYQGSFVFERTSKGVAATISSDRNELSEELWAMLSYINGRLTVEKHRRLLSGSQAIKRHGSVDNCLNILEQAGFIRAKNEETTTDSEIKKTTKKSEQQKNTKTTENHQETSLFIQQSLVTMTEIIEKDLADMSWELLLMLEDVESLPKLRNVIIKTANENKKRLSPDSKRAVKEIVNKLDRLKGK